MNKVYLAMGCYKFQGQEVIGVYDNRAAAQQACDQAGDDFNGETYVIEWDVQTECKLFTKE